MTEAAALRLSTCTMQANEVEVASGISEKEAIPVGSRGVSAGMMQQHILLRRDFGTEKH